MASIDSPFVEVEDGKPVYRIVQTKEDAIRYMSELVSMLEYSRAQVDQASALPGLDVGVRTVQKLMGAWTMRYGQCMGALTTLMHTRLLGDDQYAQFHALITATAETRTIGVV